jgi:histidinol dehydrogenase
VTFGDKVVGTNHTLPTALGARYTGGLWVGSFLKMLTRQELTADASRRLAEPAAAISRAEGLEGHAISAELRLDLDRHARAGDRP